MSAIGRHSHRGRPAALLAATLLLACGAVAAAPGARLADAAQFTQELDALRGKVVMLNVWATWCAPCLKEVPDLLAIEKELAAEGFVLLGLSIEEAADLDRVESFRQKYFPSFRTLVRDGPSMDTVVSVVDPAWNEIVPTTYIIGRDGRLVTRLQGKKTHEEFRAAARAALDARPAPPGS
jgi:thiol-disulfide isomerase/thioredoxin